VLAKEAEYQLDRSCEKEELLLRVARARNILNRIQRRKTNWTGHILCRNCLLNHVKYRQKKGDDDVEDVNNHWTALGKRRYWKLKEQALDLTFWRTRFGCACGHSVIKTT
jgi:hypothetical protein